MTDQILGEEPSPNAQPGHLLSCHYSPERDQHLPLYRPPKKKVHTAPSAFSTLHKPNNISCSSRLALEPFHHRGCPDTFDVFLILRHPNLHPVLKAGSQQCSVDQVTSLDQPGGLWLMHLRAQLSLFAARAHC